MSIDYHAVGNRIREKRKEKGLTQMELAELCGITSVHMSNIETGHKEPSLRVLVAIVNTLETEADSILFENLVRNANRHEQRVKEILSSCNPRERDYAIDIMNSALQLARKHLETALLK